MKDLSEIEAQELWKTLVQGARENGPNPDDFPSVARRLTLMHRMILITSNHLAMGLEIFQKQGPGKKQEREAELWQHIQGCAQLNGPDLKDYPSEKLRLFQEFQSILLIEKILRLRLEFQPQTQAPAKKILKVVESGEIEVLGTIQKIEKILNHPLTTTATVIGAVGIFFAFFLFEKPTAKEEFQRVVGQAILDSSPEYAQTTIDPKNVVIQISKRFIPSEIDDAGLAIEFPHKLPPVEAQRLIDASAKVKQQ